MIDAALTDGSTSYLIFGSKCCAFESAESPASQPKRLEEQWRLPSDFHSGIDAAFAVDGRINFLRGGRYFPVNEAAASKPFDPTVDLAEDFWRGLDAALHHVDGKFYLFTGSWCARFDEPTLQSRPDTGRIHEFWKDLPERFRYGIDAALRGPTGEHSYFFSGDEYVRLSQDGTVMSASKLKKNGPEWKGMPDEAYQGCHLLLAEIGVGEDGKPRAVVKESKQEVDDKTKFELVPGGGIALRCTPGIRVKKLKIWDDKPNPGEDKEPTAALNTSMWKDLHHGLVGLRCTSTGAFLRHRQEADEDEAQYYFGVTFEKDNVDYDWDPEVQNTKPGTRKRIVDLSVGGSQFVLRTRRR